MKMRRLVENDAVALAGMSIVLNICRWVLLGAFLFAVVAWSVDRLISGLSATCLIGG